ncbi:uncharacterized protein LOC143544100 [Bidens hawaiensis]|uniref:uncharacterized protein LOC143544100 n=1 Tax=Bidens hawaiensis TaxID=980011 RepID=UPI00404A7B14
MLCLRSIVPGAQARVTGLVPKPNLNLGSSNRYPQNRSHIQPASRGLANASKAFPFQFGSISPGVFSGMQVVVGSEDLAANHDAVQIVEKVLEDQARDEQLATLLEKVHKPRRYFFPTITYIYDFSNLDIKLQNPESKASAQHLQKNYLTYINKVIYRRFDLDQHSIEMNYKNVLQRKGNKAIWERNITGSSCVIHHKDAKAINTACLPMPRSRHEHPSM